MLLKFVPFAGPKSYQFKDPDTGYLFNAPNIHSLYNHIISYRVQNNLPLLEGLPEVVENYLCHLPENKGGCMPREKLKRGWLTTLRGGVTLLENLWYKKTVSQEKADERAAICIQCPHNIFPDKGAFIAWADEIAEASVGDKRSKYHDELGNCEICSCPLRPKVFFEGKITLPEDQVARLPDFCWQLKEIHHV